jgi:cytochrome bd-type quinol oxidase subunit 2
MWRGLVIFTIILFAAWPMLHSSSRGRHFVWATIVLVLASYAGFVALALQNVH